MKTLTVISPHKYGRDSYWRQQLAALLLALILAEGLIVALKVVFSESRPETVNAAPLSLSPYESHRAAQDTFTVLGQVGGGAEAAAITGSHVYVGLGASFGVLDIHDLTQPRLQDTVRLPAIVRDLAVHGSYAYVVDIGGALHVIELEGPTTPTVAATYQAAGRGYGVVVTGTFAYLMTETAVEVINISNPHRPHRISTFLAPLQTASVVPLGTLLLVPVGSCERGNCWGGLSVLDISNPTAPVWGEGYTSDIATSSVAVFDHYAVLVDGGEEGGAQVVDFSQQPPALAGRLMDLPPAFSVGVTSRLSNPPAYYAYVSTVEGGVTLDLSDPTRPTVVGNPWPTSHGDRIIAMEGYVLLQNVETSLRLLDLSTPTAPQQVGLFDTLWAVDVGVFRDAANRHYAGVVDLGSGLQVFDVSQATTPLKVGMVQVPGAWSGIISGSLAYLATYDGMALVDLAVPQAPRVLSQHTLTAPEQVIAFQVLGDFVYVIGHQTLSIIDVSQPTSPVLVSVSEVEGGMTELVVTQGPGGRPYAFIATSLQNLHSVDVSVPTAPRVVRSYPMPNTIRALLVEAPSHSQESQYLYMVSQHNVFLERLALFDISQPTALREVGALVGDWGGTVDMVLEGSRLFLGGTYAQAHLHTIDVSVPWAPAEVGAAPLPTNVQGMAWLDGMLLVADNVAGLYLLGERFALGGRVMDQYGVAIPGVSITLSTGERLETNTDGFYSRTSRLAGRYTVTPTLSGFQFWPVTQTVTFPANGQHLDFTRLPLPISTTLSPEIATRIEIYSTTNNISGYVDVPANTVSQSATLFITPTKVVANDRLLPVGPAFAVGLSVAEQPWPEVRFRAPITVSLPNITGRNSRVALWWQNGQNWEPAANSCADAPLVREGMAALDLTASICRPGLYALLWSKHLLFLPMLSQPPIQYLADPIEH